MKYKVETVVSFSTEVDESDYTMSAKTPESMLEEIKEYEKDTFNGEIPADAKVEVTVTPINE